MKFDSSPDCSGILLRHEVEQKIERKAGVKMKEATVTLLLQILIFDGNKLQ